MQHTPRNKVVAHVDLDAFYAQVEAKRNPELRGQPLVVVQYNPNDHQALKTALRPEDNRIFPHSNGSVIAVSYEARNFGVKRNMMGQEAKKLCPSLQLVQVPTAHGKADLTIYRQAGAQVADILSRGTLCERASIDEAYLDVTEEVARRLQAQQQQQQHSGSGGVPLPPSFQGIHIVGLQLQEDAAAPGGSGAQETVGAGEGKGRDAVTERWWRRSAEAWDPHERLLATGAAVVAELRAAVLKELGYTCSAGVAHYKLMAKLGSGLHKPNQQTVVLARAVPGLLLDLPIPKLRSLGGKFGEQIQKAFTISTVGELAALPLSRLEAVVGSDSAHGLLRLAHGMDDEDVQPRMANKSLSCGKTFRGNSALTSFAKIHQWLLELGREMSERIDADRQENERIPTLLTASVGALAHGGQEVGGSRSGPLRRTSAEALAADALALIKKWVADRPPGTPWRITSMFIQASNFTAAPTGASTITRFLLPSASGLGGTGGTASLPPSPQQQQPQSSALVEPDRLGQPAQALAAAGAGGAGAQEQRPHEVARRGASASGQQQHHHHGGKKRSLSPPNVGDSRTALVGKTISVAALFQQAGRNRTACQPPAHHQPRAASGEQPVLAAPSQQHGGQEEQREGGCSSSGSDVELVGDVAAGPAAGCSRPDTTASGLHRHLSGAPHIRPAALAPQPHQEQHHQPQQANRELSHAQAQPRRSATADEEGRHGTALQRSQQQHRAEDHEAAHVSSLQDWLPVSQGRPRSPDRVNEQHELYAEDGGRAQGPVPALLAVSAPGGQRHERAKAARQALEAASRFAGGSAHSSSSSGAEQGELLPAGSAPPPQVQQQPSRQGAEACCGHAMPPGAACAQGPGEPQDAGGTSRSAAGVSAAHGGSAGGRRPAAPAAASAGLTWSEVDPAVLAELPLHIQQELKRGLCPATLPSRGGPTGGGRGAKKAKTHHSANDISKYFHSR